LSPAGAGAGSALLISKEFHFACSLRVLFAYFELISLDGADGVSSAEVLMLASHLPGLA
jgi:hypothetical protein